VDIIISDMIETTYKLTKGIDLTQPEYKDKDNKMNEKGKAEQVKRTIDLHINLDGITNAEVDRYLSGQTTPVKQWYNNIGGDIADDRVLEIVKKGEPIVIGIRELLDTRKSSKLTDAEKDYRAKKKQLAGGKSVEDIRAESEAMIARIEAEMEGA